MHLEILDEERIHLLSQLNALSFISEFTMGGGTALSLQLGLRKSYDFDFFSFSHFDVNQLERELKDIFGKRMQIISKETRLSTLDIYVDQVQVSFFEYNYPEMAEKVILDCDENIKLFSIEDIACMKAVAILQRGSKKDFYDLYFILNSSDLDIAKLKTLLEKKYNDRNLISNFCYSMGYFDDAEKDVLPDSFVEYSWDDIKAYFIKLQRKLFRMIS